jgi:hypothetical protein
MEDISNFKVGLKVRRGAIDNPWNGVVVFNSTIGDYSKEFPKEHWEYLGSGYMINYKEVGLVFSKEVDDEEILVDGSRG